jgi:DNA topoisomerase IB
MWIAKWTDRLTGNLKYVWLHDSTPIKQEREEAKFEKAVKIGNQIEQIREHIIAGLTSDDPRRRMVAAACYLIDRLSLRVGDEKDPDEADTVGATTLRAEHLTFKPSSVIFDFLGKDSVPWHKELEMPPEVYSVFRELYDRATERVEFLVSRRSERTKGDPKKIAQIFADIGSNYVNRFLGEVDPDLTAKVFRTFHATTAMQEELAKSKTKSSDPEFIKMEAVRRANLEVARMMNHTKQSPRGWARSTERFEERVKAAGKKVLAARKPLEAKRRQLRELKKRDEAQRLHLQEAIGKQKELGARYWQSVLTWREKRDRAKSLWDNARDQKRRTRASHRKGKTSKKERLESTQKRIETYRTRLDNAEVSLRKAHERYEKSNSALQRKQDALAVFKERSSQQIARREAAVDAARARVRKAEDSRQKIEIDYALAKETRTWNLGTSLKSYVHPRVVYSWCRRVDYDWRKVYSKTLQRKFNWVDSGH